MKKPWRFWAVVGIGVALLLVVRWIFISPNATAAGEQIDAVKNLNAERAGHFKRSGKPIAEVEEAFRSQQANLIKLRKTLKPVQLAIPAQLTPVKAHTSALYFQKQLAALTSRVSSLGISVAGKARNLGFPPELPNDMIGEYLMRLAVAGRFFNAASAAGIKSVLNAENLETTVASQPDATVEVEQLVYSVTIAADELRLIRLLQELSRPTNFLALKGLNVVVKDPEAGVFDAKLIVAGVRPTEIKDRDEDESHDRPGIIRAKPPRGRQRRY